MYLNSIKPAVGSTRTKVRVGRGIGCGMGKTCGRGHKGQKSRSGGFHKIGFEGGQMPIQRRLPKRGFVNFNRKLQNSLKLSDLENINESVVNIGTLRKYNLISSRALKIKIYNACLCDRKFKIEGIKVSDNVKKAIESAGGTIL
jgi:large subunit ribosomal protein L15